MVGIRSYGAYIPKLRLTKDTKGWAFPGEKAVANFDEDSVTMAVAAAADCLGGIDRAQVDGLIFATTTSPYGEKQGAATIAEALDLRHDIYTTDMTGVLRAGTSGLRAAADAVKSGSARNVLVVAADQRQAAPKSDTDRSLGDAAAALLVGGDGVLAAIEGMHSTSEHMLDTWRSAEDPFVHTGEDRFVADEGYHRIMRKAVADLLQKMGLKPADIAKAAYYSASARLHADMARRFGIEPAQVQDPLYGQAGSAGAAFPLLLAVGALEEVAPESRVLIAGYGDGADAMVLKTTQAIAQRPARRGVRGHLASKETVADYDGMLQWRRLLAKEPARRPPPEPMSLQALWRERDQNLRLYASRCTACGRVQYPPQRICTSCHEKDRMQPYRLADRRGEIFTYSMDYVAGTPDTPLVITIINFQGGGRMLSMLTDRKVEDVRVGLPIEMTFRKVGVFNDGIHNYYWKAMPVRAAAAVAAPK